VPIVVCCLLCPLFIYLQFTQLCRNLHQEIVAFSKEEQTTHFIFAVIFLATESKCESFI